MANKIKGDASVSEDSAFRYGNFIINGKNVEVPLQAIDAKKYYESKINFSNLNLDISEIYKIYNKEKLNKFKTYPEEEIKEERSLALWKNNTPEDSVMLFFIRFEGKEYPTGEEMKMLIRLSYTFSDATPIPSFPDVFKEKISRVKGNGQPIVEDKIVVTEDKLKKHFSFLKEYVDTLNVLNHKDILGTIPINIGSSNIEKLLSFYYGEGINHFYIDFGGASFNRLISGPLMYSILSKIKMLGLEYQKTFFYSINGSPGRFQKGAKVIGSKDILTGGAGMDVVGRMHMRAGGGEKPKVTDPRVKEKMKLNKIRLFNKGDYGYYKLETKSIPFKLPEDNIINKEFLVDPNKGKKFGDVFNMHQLSIENENLRNYIKENYKPLARIKKEKAMVSPKDLSLIQKFKLKIKSVI